METKKQNKKQAHPRSLKKWIGKYVNRIFGKVDDYKVRKKLHILYICCVLVPLVITDSVILAIVMKADRESSRYELEKIASAVKYSVTADIENAATIAKNIYMNEYVNEFLESRYASPLEYYDKYRKFMKDSLFESSIGSGSIAVKMYADNDTMINGGEIRRLDSAKEEEWYQYLEESGQDKVLHFGYGSKDPFAVESKREISFIRRLNFYKQGQCEKLVKISLDYGNVVQSLKAMNYDTPVYICSGDRILYSNAGHSNFNKDFETFAYQDQVGYEEEMLSYGQTIKIYVLQKRQNVLRQIVANLPLILLLICVNAILPWLFIKIINRSFTERLQELSVVFNDIEGDELQEITSARGKDELGMLMRNYNKMAVRINDLIQTVYKDKLREQEMDIARQNAELLALHSQINPHFLFNALESIRMHSILKKELETAHMVGQLAVMERQYVEWGTDHVTIKEEMNFVEAYLELQRYRFGDRLSYRLEVEEQCREYYVPKLTIVTFVENACVHGIENKSASGWVFARVYARAEHLYIEIEDTGNGIEEPMLSELRYNMAHSGIARLKKKGHVGIMNACLRLRMISADTVRFQIESEKGAGTIVTVIMPLEYAGNDGTKK